MNDILATIEQEPLVVPDGYEMVDGKLVEQKMGTKSSWVGLQLFQCAPRTGDFECPYSG